MYRTKKHTIVHVPTPPAPPPFFQIANAGQRAATLVPTHLRPTFRHSIGLSTGRVSIGVGRLSRLNRLVGQTMLSESGGSATDIDRSNRENIDSLISVIPVTGADMTCEESGRPEKSKALPYPSFLGSLEGRTGSVMIGTPE